jgi:hypothetical protein
MSIGAEVLFPSNAPSALLGEFDDLHPFVVLGPHSQVVEPGADLLERIGFQRVASFFVENLSLIALRHHSETGRSFLDRNLIVISVLTGGAENAA